MRYLAAATLIVLAFIVFATRIGHGPPPNVRVTYSSATGTPGPAQKLGPLGDGSGDIGGEAPWVLSALPECFRPERHRTGPAAYALGALPPGSQPLPAGSGLVAGDCLVLVDATIVRVRRGGDRFYVPAHARLYRTPDGLALERVARGRTDVRVYSYPPGVAVRYNKG